MTNLYLIIASIVIVYILLLTALNKIPHVKIGGLGWFSLKRVEITTKGAIVKIGRIKLTINPYAKAPIRLICIDLSDVNIEVLNAGAGASPSPSPKDEIGDCGTQHDDVENNNLDDNKVDNKDGCSEDLASLTSLTFDFPERVYKLIAEWRLLRKLSIRLRRTTLRSYTLVESADLFLEYACMDYFVSKDATHKLTLSLYNAHVHDTSEEVDLERARLLKTLEFQISYDLKTSSKVGDAKKLRVSIDNLSINMSMAKLQVDLNLLMGILSHQKARPQKPAGSVARPKKANSSKIGLLSLVSNVDIQLDNTAIFYQDFELNHSNLKLNYSKKDTREINEDLPIAILFYSTSLKTYHKGYVLSDFPMVTAGIEFELLRTIRLLQELRLSQGNITAHQKKSYFNIFLTISKPVFEVYYDQIVALKLFLSSKEKKEKKSTGSAASDHTQYVKILAGLSTKITMIDLNINIHLPKTESVEFHREDSLNVVLKACLPAFMHRLAFLPSRSKKNDAESPVNNVEFLKGAFKVKGLRFVLDDNFSRFAKLTLFYSYNINQKAASLQFVSKEIMIKSVNDMFFRLVGDLRNRKNKRFNESYSKLKAVETTAEETTENDKPEFVQIFSKLPPVLKRLQIKISSVQTDIICKDGLPTYKLFDEELNDYIDLSDYKRGISLKAEGLEFKYNLNRRNISTSADCIQAFTVSEYGTEFISDFDVVNTMKVDHEEFSDLSSLDTAFENEDNALDNKTIKNVFKVRDISISNRSREGEAVSENKLKLFIPEVDGRLDIFLVWCAVYATTLVRIFKPATERKCTKKELHKLKGSPQRLEFDVNIDSIAVVIRLPNSVDVMVESDGLKMKDALTAKALVFNYLRLYVVHPATKLWARLFVLTDPYIRISKNAKDNLQLDITTNGIKLIIPHQFLFYTVIDNAITLGKAVKQVVSNFNNLYHQNHDFGKLMPQDKGALKLPNINLKSKYFGFILESDAFENELAYIFELGAIEQKERIAKVKLFEEKAEAILEGVRSVEETTNLTDAKPTQPSMKSRKSPTHSPWHNSPLRNVWKDGKTRPNDFKSASLDERYLSNFSEEDVGVDSSLSYQDAMKEVSEARKRLDIHLGTCWIQRYRKFQKAQKRKWDERPKKAWGDEKINPIMTDKYNIVNYASGPKIMGGSFTALDASLDQIHVDDLHEFLYKYGKGQPKLEYSILVPMFISLKANSFFVFLKDYTLPLISFPKNDNGKPSVNIAGNFVVNEKLVYRKEEMRFIYVPFSPAAQSLGGSEDNFYSVHIPRTLTPVKVMLDVKCDLDSERACMISWCKAYQAALLMAGAAFDKFSKPKIDDSPIGWWDKMALLVHGKIQVNVKNELCLHMKSSPDPYDLTGRASGFVFCWKNNVSLRINDTGKPQEIVLLESDSFLLAIPNYSMSERQSWSFFEDDISDYTTDIASESKKFQKRVIKLSSSERVKWILGFFFERNKDKSENFSDMQERITDFKPHYDVIVTNPKFEWHPDSYDDFRSDYLHISLSVISKSSTGQAYNAAYFTPLTFHYFFYWWDTLTKHVSLPIRRGTRFSKDPKDISKMGNRGVYTMRYQLIFEPLTISHLYLHSSKSDLDSKHHIAFTGLKGKFNSCAIDLLQRKEHIRYVNEKLGVTNQLWRLKMAQGFIDVDHADIRFLKAVFKEKSLSNVLASHGDKPVDISQSSADANWSLKDSKTFGQWTQGANFLDNDSSWLDPDDFVELHQRETLSPYPKVNVYPFFCTPKFNYYREFSLHKEGPYPFGNEPSHSYLIEKQTPEGTQKVLLKERMSSIKNEVSEKEKELKSKGLESDSHAYRKALKEIDTLKEKFAVVEELCESLGPQTTQPTEANNENGGNELLYETNTNKSAQYSIHSSFKSIDQIKEISIMNSTFSQFHNRFIIHNPQLRWDNKLRDAFLEYVQRVGERKSQVYFMSRKAVQLASSLMDHEGDQTTSHFEAGQRSTQEYKSGEEVLESFTEILSDIISSEQSAENKYLIKLIHPQIQLSSEKSPDSCVLITSTDVEVRNVMVNVKGLDDVVSENNEIAKTIESRIGVMFKDSHIFVFDKDEASVSQSNIHYGKAHQASKLNWPPWLDTETCYTSAWVKEQLIGERSTMAIIMKKPNFLVASKCSASTRNHEISFYAPKLVVNADSAQYSTIYYVVTDLLVHSKTDRDVVLDKLNKVVSLSDTQDFSGLDTRIKYLQEYIRGYRELLQKCEQKDVIFSDHEKKLVSQVEIELERKFFELSFLIKSVRFRSFKYESNKGYCKILNVFTDQIIWHLLDEDREPFVDFATARLRFSRIDALDGTSSNELEVGMVQAFNLKKNCVYPELLRPYVEAKQSKSSKEQSANGLSLDSQKSPIISLSWKTLEPVGGIPIIQNAHLKVVPLKILLDYLSAKTLFSYLFPNADDVEGEKDDSDDDDDESIAEHDDVSINSKDSTRPHRNLFKRLMSSKSSANGADSRAGSEAASIHSSEVSFSTDSASIKDLDKPKHSPVSKSQTNKSNKQEDLDDLSIIMERSKRYKSILLVEIEKLQFSLSFKAPKHLHILDVHNLDVGIHRLEYNHQVWSGEDFALKLRKEIIKVVLNNTGKILSNKFKHKKRNHVKEPLKQISDYGSYMTLQDLQSDGRPRDSSARHQSLLRRSSLGSKLGHKPMPKPKSSSVLNDYFEEVDDETEEDDSK